MFGGGGVDAQTWGTVMYRVCLPGWVIIATRSLIDAANEGFSLATNSTENKDGHENHYSERPIDFYEVGLLTAESIDLHKTDSKRTRKAISDLCTLVQ